MKCRDLGATTMGIELTLSGPQLEPHLANTITSKACEMEVGNPVSLPPTSDLQTLCECEQCCWQLLSLW